MSWFSDTALFWGALPLMLILWTVPVVDVTCSRQVSGAEKIAWAAACALTSWLAWIAFYLLAPLRRDA